MLEEICQPLIEHLEMLSFEEEQGLMTNARCLTEGCGFTCN